MAEGCDTSAEPVGADWLNGVVEARRKVLVPFERGLQQTKKSALVERARLCVRSNDGLGGCPRCTVSAALRCDVEARKLVLI